jgi:hypothetical protein
MHLARSATIASVVLAPDEVCVRAWPPTSAALFVDAAVFNQTGPRAVLFVDTAVTLATDEVLR